MSQKSENYECSWRITDAVRELRVQSNVKSENYKCEVGVLRVQSNVKSENYEVQVRELQMHSHIIMSS